MCTTYLDMSTIYVYSVMWGSETGFVDHIYDLLEFKRIEMNGSYKSEGKYKKKPKRKI